MAPFIYDKDIPPSILVEITKALEPWAWVVPVWCERVFIGWTEESSEDDFCAVTSVDYPYRFARVTFYPSFLKQSNLSEVALHELIHIPIHVIAGWTRETIKTLVSEDDAPKFRKFLLSELNDRVEASTEDLASRISKRPAK